MNDGRLESLNIGFVTIFPCCFACDYGIGDCTRPKVDLTKPTEYCSRCFTLCAPTGSLFIDPLCTACKADLRARDNFPDLDNNNPIELANFFADPRILIFSLAIDPDRR